MNGSSSVRNDPGGQVEPTGEREVERGLAFVNGLDRTERSAFLGLFAGAQFPWTIFDDGRRPHIGKAECEWVDDWRDFYSRRLREAGLFHWEEGESGPALGMIPKADGSYHTWTRIDCGPTELGRRVREAWWQEWREKVDARAADPLGSAGRSPS